MRKALAWLAALLVVGVAGAWIAFHSLDLLAKLALEHFGPDVAGVKVDVREVSIAPREGRGAIRGLVLGNPPGFASRQAASFGEIRLAIDPATATADVVRVRELAIEAPRITYERGPATTNLDVIQNHIEAYAKRAAGEGADGKSGGRERKRRFIVDRLVIRGGQVLITDTALQGQGLAVDLPDVDLRDVGRDRGGITAAEVAALVAATLQNRIAQKVLTNIEALRRGGVEGAVDALKGLLRGR